MRHLTARSAAALHRFAQDGDLTQLPTDGELRVLFRNLDGRHAVSMVRQGAVLWVVIDLTREDALAQLRELIRTWPLSAVLRMPFPTATPPAVELVG
jgi:hypothetical protein